jgi:hypothetical protein
MKKVFGVFLAIGLALPSAAFSADSGGNAASSSGGSDAAQYLTGPNIQGFYTDETMGTMRSPDEMKSAWASMKPEDQAKMKAACEANKDQKYTDLCKAVGSM